MTDVEYRLVTQGLHFRNTVYTHREERENSRVRVSKEDKGRYRSKVRKEYNK